MKKCSMSVIIKEIQVKTTMSTTSHQSEWPSLTSQQITNAGEGMEKREHSYTDGRNKLVQTTMENSIEIPQKTEYGTSI